VSCNLYSITTNQAAIIALFRVSRPSLTGGATRKQWGKDEQYQPLYLHPYFLSLLESVPRV
jgi:hypothetical protein